MTGKDYFGLFCSFETTKMYLAFLNMRLGFNGSKAKYGKALINFSRTKGYENR